MSRESTLRKIGRQLSMDIRRIDPSSFRKYGTVIGIDGQLPDRTGNRWRIVVRERNNCGWRIAYLALRRQPLRFLEQHVNSLESFEPLSGTALLFVCRQRLPRVPDCFLLDKPVVVRKGVWHGLLSLTPEAHIKITENNCVAMKKFKLSRPIGGDDQEALWR